MSDSLYQTLAELLALEYAGKAPHSEALLKQTITLLFGGYENTPYGHLICGQTPDSMLRLQIEENLGFNPNEEAYLRQVQACR